MWTGIVRYLIQHQTRSQQGQAQEFVIWTLVYGLRASLWTWVDSGLPTRPLTITQSLFDKVLLEDGGLARVVPFAVHLDC